MQKEEPVSRQFLCETCPFSDDVILVEYLGNEKAVRVPEGITIIGDRAFAGSEIRFVEFPLSLIRIGKGAFQNSQIFEAFVHEGAKSVEDEAFKGCKNLKSVHLPASLEHFGENVFGLCSDVRTVTVCANKNSDENIDKILHDCPNAGIEISSNAILLRE